MLIYIYIPRTHLTSALIRKTCFGSKTVVNEVLGIYRSYLRHQTRH